MKQVPFFVMFFSSLLMSQAVQAVDSKPNVILVMLDGVRWQEFFHGSDPLIDPKMNEPIIFKNLLSKQGRSVFIAGDKKKGSECTVSNSKMISLPAYQSIMVGKTTSCKSNSCGRVEVETLQERILRELQLKKLEVATIASWDMIPYAVEQHEGRTFVNAGIQEMNESEGSSSTNELNKKQREDSYSDARKDEYTFAHALNYVKNNKPRFLFISLNDSDVHAHSGKYATYVSTLKWYDEKLQSLFDTLDSMGEYGKSTSVIVTTDHGRGDLKEWRDHGTGSPESKYVWIYGRNPKLDQSKKNANVLATGYTHADIRPTVEALMGLTPTQCEECGKVIQALIPPPQIVTKPVSTRKSLRVKASS